MTKWLYHEEEFKKIVQRNDDEDDEEGSVRKTKEELIPFLRKTSCFRGLSASVLKTLEGAETFHTLNRALDRVYDFADERRIWLGI